MGKNQACNYAKKCGGCDYQGIEYEKQLVMKQKAVEKLLSDNCKVDNIIGAQNPYHYRNKVHGVFGRDKKGTVYTGIYQEGTHNIIPVENCLIENETASAILGTLGKMVQSFKLKVYDEDRQTGLFRHALIRVGHATGQILVVLVLSSPVFPSKNNFIAALCKAHPEITSIVLNVNNKRTNMILGDKNIVLYGKGYIEDKLCKLTFRISPHSFYQINSWQTEVLYQKALEFAGLTGTQRVIDAYCGIGTIGMAAADRAGEVIGVELNKAAVEDARANAKRNQIKNIRFVNDDAGKFMVKMAGAHEKADVVLMDPPRSGSTEEFIEAVRILAPERVVYISCNPVTLARDLKVFAKKGYRAQRIVPVDMFGFTEHVETIVLLSHKSPDSHINVKIEFGEGDGKVPLDAIAERARKYQPKQKVTYKMIQEYVEKKYGFKVHTAYIAEVKRALGVTMYDAPNAVEELKQPRKHPPKEKIEAITDALKYFEVI